MATSVSPGLHWEGAAEGERAPQAADAQPQQQQQPPPQPDAEEEVSEDEEAAQEEGFEPSGPHPGMPREWLKGACASFASCEPKPRGGSPCSALSRAPPQPVEVLRCASRVARWPRTLCRHAERARWCNEAASFAKELVRSPRDPAPALRATTTYALTR